MSDTVRGLTIELAADQKKFNAAMKDINTGLKNTREELKAVRSSLEMEWDASKFKRAQELSQKAVEQTAEKVKLLKARYDEMAKQEPTEATRKGMVQLEKDIAKADLAAQRAAKELKEINNIKFDQTIESAKRLDESVDRTAKGAAAAGVAILGIVTALAKFGLSQIEVGDNIATTADKLGITTTELQRYQYIATQSDVSSEALSKAMVKLNGDIGELAVGVKAKGSQALLELVGSIHNVDGSLKSTDQVFKEVIGNLSQIEDSAVRAGIANQIFSERFASELNPIIAQGADALAEYNAEFERVGHISEENIAKLSEIDNKINETKAMFQQISAEAGMSLMPVFEEVIEYLQEHKEDIKDFAVGFLETLVKVVKAVWDARGAVIAFVVTLAALKIFSSLAVTITTFQKSLQGATVAQAALNTTMKANPALLIASAIGALVGVLGLFSGESEEAKTKAEEYNDTADTLTKTLDALADATKRASEATGAEAESLQVANRREAIVLLGKLREGLEDVATAQEEVNRKEKESQDLFDSSLRMGEQVNNTTLLLEQLKGMTEGTEEYARALDVANKEMHTNGLSADALSRVIANQEQIIIANTTAIEGNNDELNAGAEATKKWNESLAFLIRSGLITAGEAATTLGMSVQEVNRIVAEVEVNTRNATTATVDFAEAQESMAKMTADTVTELKTLSATQEKVAKGQSLTAEEILNLTNKYPELLSKVKAMGDGYVIEEGALDDLRDARISEWKTQQQAEADKTLTAMRESAARLGIYEQEIGAIKDLESAYNARAAIEAGPKVYLPNGVVLTPGESLLKDTNSYIELQESIKKREEMLRSVASGAGSKTSTKSTGAKAAPTEKDVEAEAYEAALKRLDNLRRLDELSEVEYSKRVKALRQERLSHLKRDSDEWYKIKIELFDAEQAANERQTQEMLDDLTQRTKDLDYHHDIGIEADATYYAKLRDLAKEYLVAYGEFSDQYRGLMRQLYAWEKQERDKAASEAQAALDAEIKAREDSIKAAYESRKKQIEDELELEKKRVNGIIEGIDAEIAARRRLREDEDYDVKVRAAQKRLEASKAELEFFHGEDKKALENQIIRDQQALDKAIQDRDDALFYREMSDRKDALNASLKASEEAARAQIEQLKIEEQTKLSGASVAVQTSGESLREAWERASAAGAFNQVQTSSAVSTTNTFNQTINATTPQNTSMSANMLGFIVANALSALIASA